MSYEITSSHASEPEDPSARTEPNYMGTGPLDADDLQEDTMSEVMTVAFDTHSSLAEPAPNLHTQSAYSPTATMGQEQGPVSGGSVESPPTPAAQTVVDTARQATQQVAAVVQQQAQKITVAPRKAIYRGKRFVAIYGGLVGVAGVLAFMARKHRYFAGDVGITRLIQRPNAKIYDELMHAVSQPGWRWISVGTRASLSTLMWAAGFRMESAFTVSTWTGDILTSLIKTRVLRPRPTKDLVRVVSDLEEASFPSGHVVHYVTFYGFLFYLAFTHLKKRWFRTALLTLLAGLIVLVGPSRVYMGHHWPSDVGGAYLVGTLWLGVIIIAYLETKANYTLHTHPPFFVKRPAQLK